MKSTSTGGNYIITTEQIGRSIPKIESRIKKIKENMWVKRNQEKTGGEINDEAEKISKYNRELEKEGKKRVKRKYDQ